MVGPLFELMFYASLFELKQTNMHKPKVIVKMFFVRSKACQLAFEELKKCPILAPIFHQDANFGCRVVYQRSGRCFVFTRWEKGSGCGLCK